MSRRWADDPGERATGVRIDVDVFEAFGNDGLDQCGRRPRIVRWLDCWRG